MSPLRPLGLGELIDRSVSFWRSNWRPLFQLMLGFQLVEFTLVASAQSLGRWLFPLAHDGQAIQQQPMQALPHLLASAGMLFTAVLASLLISQVAGVATTHFAFTQLANRGTPTPGDAFRYAAQRLWPTTGAFALSLGWSLVVGLVLLLPALIFGGAAAYFATLDRQSLAVALGVLSGGAGLLGGVVLVLWFVVRFILVSQIVAIEPVRAMGAFRRSDALSSGRVDAGFVGLVKVRLTILVTIIGGVLLIVSSVASAPTLIAGAVFGAGLTAGQTLNDVVPLAILVPLQLIQTVLGALVAPLYVIFQTFFYTDMRVRREGLDLELALTP